jgi:hypothetical protein
MAWQMTRRTWQVFDRAWQVSYRPILAIDLSPQSGRSKRDQTMRRLYVFALFLLSSAAWGAEGPSFHLRPPAVGERATLTSDSIIEVAFQGATSVIRMLGRRVFEAKVLEANDKAATKVLLHYIVAEANTETEGKLRQKAQPVAGKTYLFTAKSTGVDIVHEGGGELSKAELDWLKVDLDSFGKPDPLCAYLDGKTLTPGETFDGPNLVTSMLGSILEKGNIESISLQFREIQTRRDGTPEGLFGFQVKALMPNDQGAQIEMSSSGTMEVALDPCRRLSMEMAGSLAVSGAIDVNGRKVPVQGQGTAKINFLAQYQ